MITASMFRRQTWTENNDELDHITTSAQRILKLSAQYENHSHVKEFTRECNVVFIKETQVMEV